MYTLLDGKALSQTIKQEIKLEVDQIIENKGKIPHLAAILVGENGASLSYVASKIKSCAEIGFKSTLIEKLDTISQEELLAEIKKVNEDPDIDGLIVQLPLPNHIDANVVTEAIDVRKDVDGFHPINVGRMSKGLPAYISATPYGILEMLERYQISTAGKHCVVIGRSQIVGLPMAILMQRNAYPGNCTVTITHSKTQNLSEITKSADIVIVALGVPQFLKADMIKEGAVVIDVGITRVPDASKKQGFRTVGDVDFDNVAPKTSFITPVPGGVGLMTIGGLLTNTLLASKKAIYG